MTQTIRITQDDAVDDAGTGIKDAVDDATTGTNGNGNNNAKTAR